MLTSFKSLIHTLRDCSCDTSIDIERTLVSWDHFLMRERTADSSSFRICKKVVKGKPRQQLSVSKVYHEHVVLRERDVQYYAFRETRFVNGIDRLANELNILSSLKGASSNLVELEEICFLGSKCFVFTRFGGSPIMKYLESVPCYSAFVLNQMGVSLYNIRPEESPTVLTEEDALTCMRQLLSAAEVLHSKFIVHKDIKPENVVLDYPLCRWRDADKDFKLNESEWKHNRPIHITLIDFSISERREDGRIFDAQGTTLFTPPEVFSLIDPEKGVDGFARDAWSVGMLGYCLLSGIHPLPSAESSLEYQLNLLRMRESGEKIVLPKNACRDIPRLRSVIKGLLDLNPETRLTVRSALVLLADCGSHMGPIPTSY
jgi:serine/threonine protein kinase